MVDILGSKSCGNARKYAAAPMTASRAGPNQATANHGRDFLNPRGLMRLFLNPSRVTRRVMSTPRAGKNMAAPVANCAATGGTPTSAPDDIGYTTPNSYAQVNINVTARNIAILFTMHSFLDRGVPSLARRLVRDMCVTRLVDRTPPTSRTGAARAHRPQASLRAKEMRRRIPLASLFHLL